LHQEFEDGSGEKEKSMKQRPLRIKHAFIIFLVIDAIQG